MFDSIDLDANGSVSADELRIAFRKRGGLRSQVRLNSKVTRVMEALGARPGDEVTWEQFHTMCMSQPDRQSLRLLRERSDDQLQTRNRAASLLLTSPRVGDPMAHQALYEGTGPKYDFCLVFPYDEEGEKTAYTGNLEEEVARVLATIPMQEVEPQLTCFEEFKSIFTEQLEIDVDHHPALIREVRTRIISRIEEAGVECKTFLSRDRDELFLNIRCPDEILFKMAELCEHQFKLLDSLEGGWVEYMSHHHDKYLKLSTYDWTWFGERDRQLLMYMFLGLAKKRGGCELKIRHLKHAGFILHAFPLHVGDKKDWLLTNWSKSPFAPQPLDEVKEYLGEKIALYFKWLGHYAMWLLFPGVLGIIFTIMNYTVGFSKTTPYWCAFMCFWCTLYLEHWKRTSASQSFHWGTQEFTVKEEERPEYVGRLIRDYRGRLLRVYPTWKKTLKIALGAPIIISIVSLAVAAVTAVMIYRSVVRNARYGVVGAISAGMINALVIGLMNKLYEKVAHRLNAWENHRTLTEEEDFLIIKSFLFQFVNSYSSLFYIAFIKGTGLIAGDQCKSFSDPNEHDCISELSVQLGSIFVTQFTVGNFMELGLPMLKTKIKIYREERAARKAHEVEHKNSQQDIEAKPEKDPEWTLQKMTPEEEQSKLEDYSGTFEDYNEMVIQFGYVTLFSVAFPLVASLALINNFVEIRSDSFKILTCFKRPVPYPCQNIGTWFNILEVVGYIAVITNVALYFVTSELGHHADANSNFREDLTQLNQQYDGVSNDFTNFTHFFWAEHVLVICKLIMQAVIPDVPQSVANEWEKRNWFAKKHTGQLTLDEE